MQELSINLCRAITIGELFRLDDEFRIEEQTTLHPQDLEGLVNLRELYLKDSNLRYQNFQYTPNLRVLALDDPVNYKHLELGHLTKLQELYIETENAECTLLKQGYIQQLLGGLENLKSVYFGGRLYMPRTEQNYESVTKQVQAEVLRATDSPHLERDNIRINIQLYGEDSQDSVSSCSEGH